MVRTWRLAALFLVTGVVLAVAKFAGGAPGEGIIALVLFGAVAVVMSPLIFPRGRGGAVASPGNTEAIVYWRPGCQYCLRLRVRLGGTADRARWINIWDDAEAAAAVRAAAGGNETVPTVVLGGEAFVNPDPGWVRRRLEALPHP